jgi:D-glycero-alpha-D-manno-heptose-7-phosphate kinase
MKKIILKSRAPVRLDLSGGWTDVPPFSSRVGGAVISASINRYTYATVVPLQTKRIEITSADYSQSISVNNTKELEYDGKLDLVKAAIKKLKIKQGLDLYVRSDAPPNSGMGTSASAGVALIGLLNRMQNDKLTSHEIANLARILEVEELHIAGGKQDQYSAAFGGINFMEFKDPVVSISPLRLSEATINEMEKHLVLCYTGISRLSGNLITRVMNEYEKGVKKTVEALHSLKKIAIDMKIALLNGDTDKFGILLGENWKNQKKLHESVTNPVVDALFKIAMKNGAIGGKALGAGGGGCLLFYCELNTEHKVKKALADQNMQLIDWNFEFKGLQAWKNIL